MNFSSVNYRNIYAPNILRRLILSPSYIKSKSIFQPYTVKDGETPESIAYYYYDDIFLDWIVLLSNDIFSIKDEWVLTQSQLDKFVEGKYGSLSNAYSTISHYTLDLTKIFKSKEDFKSLAPELKKYWIYDANSDSFEINFKTTSMTINNYNHLPVIEQIMWQPVTQYAYEFIKNENKRQIKLIDKSYVPQLKKLMENAGL